jgi:hypothetical protein
MTAARRGGQITPRDRAAGLSFLVECEVCDCSAPRLWTIAHFAVSEMEDEIVQRKLARPRAGSYRPTWRISRLPLYSRMERRVRSSVLIDAMERHGHLKLDAVVRTRLLGLSAATIDRMLGFPGENFTFDSQFASLRVSAEELGPDQLRPAIDWLS